MLAIGNSLLFWHDCHRTPTSRSRASESCQRAGRHGAGEREEEEDAAQPTRTHTYGER